MRGVKHVGQFQQALARGEVLPDEPVRVRRPRAAAAEPGAARRDLAVAARHRDHRRRHQHHGVVAATPQHLVTAEANPNRRRS